MNKTYLGTKMPRTNPCRTCPKDADCNTICYNRARYWDYIMEKIRRNLGIEERK